MAVVGEMRLREQTQSGLRRSGHGEPIESIHFLEGRHARSLQSENNDSPGVEIFRQAADLADGFAGVAIHIA